MTLLAAIWFEYEIVRHKDVYGKPRSYRDGGLHIQGPPDHLLARLIETLACSLPNGLREIVLAVAGAGFGAHAQDCRQRRRFEQHTPVIVDFVFKPRIAFRVDTGLALQNDRFAIWQDQAIPDEQSARLTECNLRIVLADQFASLRDKQKSSGRTVVTILRHLRGDFTGQI
jgi:hypothetical protein